MMLAEIKTGYTLCVGGPLNGQFRQCARDRRFVLLDMLGGPVTYQIVKIQLPRVMNGRVVGQAQATMLWHGKTDPTAEEIVEGLIYSHWHLSKQIAKLPRDTWAATQFGGAQEWEHP